MVVSATHFNEVTNGYERTTSGLWTHKGRSSLNGEVTVNGVINAITIGQARIWSQGWGDANVELVTPAPGEPRIGFHESGSTALSLYKQSGSNTQLRVRGNSNEDYALAGPPGTAQQRIGSFAATVNWATPATGAWYETPIQANATVSSAASDIRIEANLSVYNTGAGGYTYVAWGLDGVAQQSMVGVQHSTANYPTPASFVFYVSSAAVAGTHRWSVHLLTYSAQYAIINTVLSCLWITEQKC